MGCPALHVELDPGSHSWFTAAPPAVFDQHYDFYYVLSVDTVRRDSICTLTMLKDGCGAVQVLCAGKSAAAAPAVGWAAAEARRARP